MGFALSDYRFNGFRDHAVRGQHHGEEGQILVPHGLLQGDAGGGNEDGPRGPQTVEHSSGHQIGIGLADAGSGVAESDTSALHNVQHPVTQCDLLRAFRHPLGGE